MTKPEDEKSDGLEIISIGTLYSGPWDKKYWSSSRGKDRYPFPIGYKAVRTYNGITYKMEIHEGPKGPSFSITSTDGQSCSGQTPDMAWESFQKKGCPRIKLWHGKRFSCKIDGVEFFGFKNAFVQRLLRELVTHGGVTAEHNGFTSSVANGGSATKHQTSRAESCSNPDPTKLEKPLVKEKRSRKIKSINSKPIRAASLKKIRTKDEVPNDGTKHKDVVYNDGTLSKDEFHNDGTSGQGYKNYPKCGTSRTFSASNEQNEICNNSGASAVSMNLETVAEGKNGPFPVKDDLPVESCHSSDHHLKDEVLLQNDCKLVNYLPTRTTGNLSRYENHLDRSRPEVQESSLPMPEEHKDGEVSVVKDTQSINDVDLCVPDTLDFQHDRTRSNCQKQSPCNGICELIAGDVIISERIASDSHPEEETSTSNANSEKSDFDSVGEDITKSMMTVLLPQALPLLKTFSRKKRRGLNSPEIFTGVPSKRSILDREEMERAVLPNLGQGSDVFSAGRDEIITSAGSSFSNKNFKRHKDLSENPKKAIISESVIGGLSSTENSFYASDEDMCRSSGVYRALKSSPSTIDDKSTGTVSSRKESPKEICDQTMVATVSSSLTENPNAATLTRQNKGPLSESIIFRSSPDTFSPGTYAASKFVIASDCHPDSSFDHGPYRGVSSGGDVTHEELPFGLQIEENYTAPNGVVCNKDPAVSKDQVFVGLLNNKQNMDLLDPSVSCLEKSGASVSKEFPRHQNLLDDSNVSPEKLGTSSALYDKEVTEGSWLNPQIKIERTDEPASTLHFVGRYVHPLPVSLVLLSAKENEVCICVLCGALVEKDRTLFMYKLSMKEQMLGCPSFIGHTALLLPLSRDAFGREIAMDRSCLQFTPDGHSLVLLNSVKAPCCREGDLQCPCSACRSTCIENNTLKVVQVKRGYVSVVVKLKTAETVHCILVCEPNYLVGIEESGKLHLWVMNSAWSELIEECDLSTSDCIFPCIVELKRIPNNAALVLGHNGFGEFGLWDICKRIFVARFSSPSTSIFQFLPISVFRWQKKDLIFTEPHGEGHITKIMAATRVSFSKQVENHAYMPMHGEDVAIWLLISTFCSSDAQHEFQSSDHKLNRIGLWRLGLLVENRVILGSALDQRAAAIGVSAGDGIIGTSDGLAYMWDLSTGIKLCNLHHFQGADVSCIAADDSGLGPLAIAGGDQLLVYLHSHYSLVSATMG